MSDAESATTELKTQYGAQVAADLERNAKEQESVAAEVTALQERLRALQHDHAMLVNLQQTLGNEPGEAAGAVNPDVEESNSAGPSVPRQATADSPSTGQAKAVVGVGTKGRAAEAKQPTLVEVIRRHLAVQSEPRSSAEITTALTQAHPERDIKPKVVRTTVEGLVAKGHVHRTKQGSSVFYTASQPTESVDESAQGAAPVAS
ncbi:BlaI/MecI/CopY family transcriptional regulator [Streptomyces sp. NPDC093982]|uniref:BlaI/MecI/CopY family transcriptional regulator n=1 Tax=Streptomyces sp. NPDC093982 TaxID=3155077 RepID=UPI0034256404